VHEDVNGRVSAPSAKSRGPTKTSMPRQPKNRKSPSFYGMRARRTDMSHCLSLLPQERKHKVTSVRSNATTEAGGGASFRPLRSPNRQEKKKKKAEDARADEMGLDNRGDQAGQVDVDAATSTAETSAHTTAGPDTFRRILSE